MIDHDRVDLVGDEETDDPGVMRSVGPLIVEAIPFDFMKLPGRDVACVHFGHDDVMGFSPTGIEILSPVVSQLVCFE